MNSNINAVIGAPHVDPADLKAGQKPANDAAVLDRAIGDILVKGGRMTEDQVTQVLKHQAAHGTYFGEAAIALRLVSNDDVFWALSQQFHFPLAPHGGIELHDDLVAAIDPFSEHAELFREVRTNLLQGALHPDLPKRALAVISPNIGDGKSFVTANLAVTFSQLGGRTLLVDADMRTPRQHEIFKIPGHHGLSHLLSGRSESNVIHQITSLPSLFVLPAGAVPPNPLELVQRPAFPLLLEELLTKFDYVLVDTPAAQHGADARVVAGRCAALAVGRIGKTKIPAMEALLKSMGKTTVRSAGVLMNEH